MGIQSGFLDTLRLGIEGKYNMSDRDLISLSDIILAKNLGDIAEKGYLIPLLYCMDKNDLRFPISYNFMKSIWEEENLIFSFNTILSELIQAGLITLRKMQEDTFFASSNINKTNLDVPGEQFYVTIFGTALYSELVAEINKSQLMSKKLFKDIRPLEESVNLNNIDKKFADLIKSLVENVKSKLYINLSIESYNTDEIKQDVEINMILSVGVNSKETTQTEIERVLTKYLKSNYILDYEGYKDGTKEVFLHIKLDSRTLKANLVEVGNQIFMAINGIVDLVS